MKRKRKKYAFCKSFKSEDTITNLDNLYKSGLLCKHGVRWKASTQKFLYDILLNCYRVKQEVVKNKKVHHGFVVFTLVERGKAREAYSIHIRERMLHRNLSDSVLMPFVVKSIVSRNCASIKGKGEIYAEDALRKDLRRYYNKHHDNKAKIIFLDASKYFCNINRKTIKEKFSLIGDDVIQRVIKQFSDAYGVYKKFNNEKGYGLGTQFVQIAGIYALSPLDHHIKECEKGGGMSTRYMDDTYILTEEGKEKELLEKYMRKSEGLGFPVNRNKCITTPVSKPFVWLKKLYSLTETGKVYVRIGYKTATRERHAIMSRKEWVNEGKISYFSYVNQVRSWLINVRKHYDSTAPCMVIERTFQYCFYRLLEDNKAPFIKRLNKLIKTLKNENIVVLIHVCTLYMTFDNDAAVLSRVMGKKPKDIRYVNEGNIKKAIDVLEQKGVNYIIVKETIKDKLAVSYRIKSLNAYKHYL